MLESIFTLCAWLIQLIAVFLIPGSLLLFCYKKFSSKTFLYACITIVLIFSILLGACLTAPIQRCNSGIYSKNIPVIKYSGNSVIYQSHLCRWNNNSSQNILLFIRDNRNGSWWYRRTVSDKKRIVDWKEDILLFSLCIKLRIIIVM